MHDRISSSPVGGLPAIIFLERFMRELSIHVDESGDFGDYSSKFAPYYIFTLVFHEQENGITENIKVLDREIIFIDESSDFGKYDYHSPYYIITMIFHD